MAKRGRKKGLKSITVNGIIMKAMSCFGVNIILHPEYEERMNTSGVYTILDHVNRLFYVGRSPEGIIRNAVYQTVSKKFWSESIGSVEVRIPEGGSRKQNQLQERLVREHTALGYRSLNSQNHWSASPNL